MNKRVVIFLALVLLVVQLPAQKTSSGSKLSKKEERKQNRNTNKPVDFLFDSSGKLVGFPKTVIRKNRNFCSKVIVPGNFVFRQAAKFITMLDSTNVALNDTARYISYSCYFKNSNFDFDAYLKTLSGLVDQLKDKDQFLRLVNKPGELDSLKKFKEVPAYMFFNNLLNQQFEIRVSAGANIIGTFPLKAHYDSKEDCFYFMDCEGLDKYLCKNCGSEKPSQLTFELITTDPFSQTMKDWFELRNKELAAFKISVDSLEGRFKRMGTLATTDATFKQTNNTIDEIKEWFPYWFWFTKGQLELDPFRTINVRVIEGWKQKAAEYDRLLVLLKPRKAFLDSVLKKVEHKLDKMPLFKEVQDSALVVSDSIDKLTKLKRQLENKINSKEVVFKRPKSLLNSVPLFISYFNTVRPQHQLDAANEYKLVAKTKRRINRVTEVPDNEESVIVAYNIDSSLKIKFDQDRVAFTDEEEFTQLLTEQLQSIDLSALTPQMIGNTESIIGSFTKSKDTRTGASLTDATKENLNKINCRTHYNGDIFNNPVYERIRTLGQELAAGTITLFYENSNFDGSIPATPTYKSIAEKVKYRTESPIKDSIGIIQTTGDKEEMIAQTRIKVGKLRFVQIAAGIAMTDKPVTMTSIDTTINGFRTSISDNKARAIIGFKVYPFQHYTRDRWLIPRYPLRRISIFGGFEMLKPLNNFYIGGCYDIVPGLGFSVGANYHLVTTYRIENNTVTETHRNYETKGVYYSVMVNPKLFVQFVKLFFKSI